MVSHARAGVAAPIGSRIREQLRSEPVLFFGVAGSLVAGFAFLGVGSGWLAALAVAVLATAGVRAASQRSRMRGLVEARRALTVSEQKFRGLYESVAAALLFIAPGGACRGANPAFLRLLGYRSEQEFLAVDFREHTFAGPGTFDALLSRTRQDGELQSVELNLRRRDGIQLMTAGTLRASWDDAGEVTGFEFTVLDISDLKLAERQRRSIERRFRRLFDSNAVGVMFGNLQRGTLEEANGRVQGMVGLRAAELPVLLDGLSCAGESSLTDAIRAALESGGHAPPIDRTYVRGDGTRVAVSVCAAVTDPLQGDFIAVVMERGESVASEPVGAGTPLHESVLDSMPLLVARFDLSAELTYCNRSFLDWFGFASAPFGWSLEELFGADCQRAMADRLDRVRAGFTEATTLELFRVGGQQHRLEVTFAPHRRSDGGVGGFLTILRDGAKAAVDADVALPVPMERETIYTG